MATLVWQPSIVYPEVCVLTVPSCLRSTLKQKIPKANCPPFDKHSSAFLVTFPVEKLIIHRATMKTAAFLLATLSLVSAFAPQQAGRSNTALSESLFDKVGSQDTF